jgi:hypothetical protein
MFSTVGNSGRGCHFLSSFGVLAGMRGCAPPGLMGSVLGMQGGEVGRSAGWEGESKIPSPLAGTSSRAAPGNTGARAGQSPNCGDGPAESTRIRIRARASSPAISELPGPTIVASRGRIEVGVSGQKHVGQEPAAGRTTSLRARPTRSHGADSEIGPHFGALPHFHPWL